MSAGDLLRALVFLTCVAVICLLAAARYTAVVPVLALVGVICLLYGRFVEPYWLEIKHVSIPSKRIRPGTSLRIVHFSDLHSGAGPRLEARLPELIAAQKPDVIVFTGDAVVNARGLPLAHGLFAALSSIAPVYAVRGNHDHPFKDKVFAVNGVHDLERDVAELEVRGNRVYILGAADRSDDALPALVRSTPEDGFHILLYHRPDEIERIAALGGIDLYCAGHTHGGQVALPWYGAIITLTKLGKKYESGLYRVGDTYLYINRGLGMDRPRVRFLARPEITVLDILPAYTTGT
jgi:predicted MPP superfamily phosphohydrolase